MVSRTGAKTRAMKDMAVRDIQSVDAFIIITLYNDFPLFIVYRLKTRGSIVRRGEFSKISVFSHGRVKIYSVCALSLKLQGFI